MEADLGRSGEPVTFKIDLCVTTVTDCPRPHGYHYKELHLRHWRGPLSASADDLSLLPAIANYLAFRFFLYSIFEEKLSKQKDFSKSTNQKLYFFEQTFSRIMLQKRAQKSMGKICEGGCFLLNYTSTRVHGMISITK